MQVETAKSQIHSIAHRISNTNAIQTTALVINDRRGVPSNQSSIIILLMPIQLELSTQRQLPVAM
jgi:hypothetical protein